MLDDLKGKINFILDGGPCQVGVESTVVDGTTWTPPLILRPGGVSWKELVEIGGKWADTEIGYDLHSHANSVERDQQIRRTTTRKMAFLQT